MAKRRKEKEEEFKFEIPKFDEEAFVKREKRNAKVAIVSFLFALFVAIISQFLWAGMSPSYRWYLVLLLALSMMSILRYLFIRLNIDLSDFSRKEKFGTFATYFLTWLVLFIVLVNPPFYDGSAPLADMAILPEIQELGGNVTIAAYITDNAGIKSINLSIEKPDGTVLYPEYREDGNVFIWSYENTNRDIGNFTVRLCVEDVNGHVTEVNGSFKYSNDAIKLVYPENGTILNYGTPLRFYLDEAISTEGIYAYYEVDSNRINLTKNGEFYESSPMYYGWRANENNVTVRVFAEVRHCFYDKCINNTVVDSSYYVFSTEDDLAIGTKEPPESNAKLPEPHSVSLIPGFEVPIALLAIVVIALIMRKRK